MPIIIKGKSYKTITDVAKEVGYSKTSILNWIKNEDLPHEYEIVKRGKMDVKTYSDKYIEKIKKLVETF